MVNACRLENDRTAGVSVDDAQTRVAGLLHRVLVELDHYARPIQPVQHVGSIAPWRRPDALSKGGLRRKGAVTRRDKDPTSVEPEDPETLFPANDQ